MTGVAFVTWLACVAAGPSEPARRLPELAVLPLRTTRLFDERPARALDTLLLAEVQRQSWAWSGGRYTVLDPQTVLSRLGAAGIRRALACTDTSCRLRTAEALGVRYAVAGSFTRLREAMRVELEMVDARKGKAIAHATLDGRDYAPGYPDFAGRVVTQLEPISAPASASALIETDPPGAALVVDDVEAGAAPQTVALLPGEHEVRATLEGYPEHTRWLTVAVDEKASLVLRMSKDATGKLVVAATPRGAHVTVAKAPLGDAPADGNALALALAPGRYDVQASLDGWVAGRAVAAVANDAVTSVKLDLLPLPPSPRLLRYLCMGGGVAAFGFAIGAGVAGKSAADDFSKTSDYAFADKSRAWTGAMLASAAVGVVLEGVAVWLSTRPPPTPPPPKTFFPVPGAQTTAVGEAR